MTSTASRPSKRIPTWEIWLIGLAVFVLAYTFWPQFADQGSEPAGNSACLSNLKQLGAATLLYTYDNHDRMPLKNWTDSATPYYKDRQLVTCPVVRNNEQQFGYALNQAAVGINVLAVEETTKMPMYFEVDDLRKNAVADLAAQTFARHEGESIVTYMDSHGKKVRDPKMVNR
ncbi:MAG: hypothetical protein ABL962_12640 [Fimbriimonadaceae bacterium]